MNYDRETSRQVGSLWLCGVTSLHNVTGRHTLPIVAIAFAGGQTLGPLNTSLRLSAAASPRPLCRALARALSGTLARFDVRQPLGTTPHAAIRGSNSNH